MNKTRSLFLAGCVVLVATAFFSCKSTPPAETDNPETVVPEQNVQAVTDTKAPVDPALTALREKVEALRNECLKYELGKYRADDWSAAESFRDQGNASYESDGAAATASYNEAIVKYEAVKREGFKDLAAEMEKELKAERDAAIAAGARSYYPAQFALADTAYEAAGARLAEDNPQAAYDEAQKALMRYKLLQKGLRAIELKQKIERNKFDQYDSEAFALAGAKYDEAAAAYGTADAAALDAANESVTLYEKVNNAGYRAWSQELIAKNEEIRSLCDSIKARRSMTSQYDAALDLYNQGQAFGKADEWELAYGAYSESAVAFTDVYQQANLKRDAASYAIESAKGRQDESTALAIKADEIAPLPEGAEGFTEETKAEPVAEPVAEPAVEPVSEPVAEPVSEPVAEPVTEPVAESAAEPVLSDGAEEEAK